jgi:hypothetical protein
MTTPAGGTFAFREWRRRVGHERVTVIQVLVISIVGVLAGVAAAWVAGRVDTGWLLTGLTTVVLCMPVGVAAARLRQSPRAVVPFIVALGLVYFFVPRLLAFDPSSGLVAKVVLTPDEIERSKTLTQAVLIAFALPIVLLYRAVPTLQHRPQDDERRQDAFRSTLRVRTAIVLGVVGSLVGVAIGLTLGTRSRNFESAGAVSPLSMLEFCAITVPAALWLAGYRRLSVLLLVLSMAGPYLKGGRQDILTPMIVLLIVVIAKRHRRTSGRRDISVKAIALVILIVVGAVGASIATTSRRATVDTAVNGQQSPSILSTLVEDQTLFDPLLIAVALEPRPQGPEIYGRVLAAPIPRAVWPDKPFSYDYDFRQRHFPQYEDAIPISLVGTSFVSFLLPGAVLAGLLVASLALAAEALLGRTGQRSILVAALMAIFVLDLVRIGGGYRELLTFVGSVLGVVLITRPAIRVPPAPIHDPDGAALDVHVR